MGKAGKAAAALLVSKELSEISGNAALVSFRKAFRGALGAGVSRERHEEDEFVQAVVESI